MHEESRQQSPGQVRDKVADTNHESRRLDLSRTFDFVANLSQTLSQSRHNGIWDITNMFQISESTPKPFHTWFLLLPHFTLRKWVPKYTNKQLNIFISQSSTSSHSIGSISVVYRDNSSSIVIREVQSFADFASTYGQKQSTSDHSWSSTISIRFYTA